MHNSIEEEKQQQQVFFVVIAHWVIFEFWLALKFVFVWVMQLSSNECMLVTGFFRKAKLGLQKSEK